MNILITSAGRRVGLLRRFERAVANVNSKAEVFVCDMNPLMSPACRSASRAFSVPSVLEADYADKLLEICLKNQVGMIVPTIDTELELLAKNKVLFAKHGIVIVVSDEKILSIANDKRLGHQFFQNHGISCAQEYSEKCLEFPLLIKPANGSCSKGIRVIESEDDFSLALLKRENLMLLQYFSPKDYDEFTVDAYYDKNGKLKCAVPRQRIETRGGEISKGITCKNELVDLLQNKLGSVHGIVGCVNWQFFIHQEKRTIFASELNPRFGGGVLLSIEAGADFPTWLVREYLLGDDLDSFHNWQEGLLMLRFDEEIYI